jgi:tetratricopeptide (TPR) repeat protein
VERLTDRVRSHLDAGRAVWLQGLPGAGRSFALEWVARRWPHAVLWLSAATWTRREVLQPGLERPLVCVDDAPGDLPADGWGGAAVVAAGELPPPGWAVVHIPPPPADAAVALFLAHAPGAEPLSAVRALVRTLGGHPLAVVAAARRWPLEALDDLLRAPLADAPGLQASFTALPLELQRAVRVLATVRGRVPRDGAAVLGVVPALGDLVARGWLRIPAPGWVEVPLVARLAFGGPPPPATWTQWLLEQASARMPQWEEKGGDRAWLAHIGEGWRDVEPDGHVLAAQSLSGADAAGLLSACGAGHARAAARALHSLGRTRDAIGRLSSVGPDHPEHSAAVRERGVLEHRLRELDRAEADYRTALAVSRHPRQTALCLANLAAVHHDRGEIAAAEAAYRDALAAVRQVPDARLEAAVLGNLGAARIEAGALGEARQRLAEAIGVVGGHDPRLRAVAQVNLAAVDLLEGCPAAAADRYRDALLAFDDDPVSEALCRARLSAVLAGWGDLESAAEQHERARERVGATDDAVAGRVVELWRGFLDLAGGHRTDVVRRVAAARQGQPPLLQLSDDARLAVRLLERRLADRGDALCVGPAGAWFRVPGGERIDVARFAAPARLLATLAAAAEQQPGVALTGEVLFAAGWPDVRIRDDAARNRLKVALAKLRKLGLHAALARTSGGWLIDPAWPVLCLRE